LELGFIGTDPRGLGLAILHCKEKGGEDKPIAIHVRDLFLTMNQFERVRSEEFERLDLRRLRPSQYPMRRVCIRKGHMMRARRMGDLRECNSTAPILYPDGTLRDPMDSGERTALLRAAETGDEGDVWLVLTRSDIEAKLEDVDGQAALSRAIERGHEAVIKVLLARSRTHLKGVTVPTLLLRAAQTGRETVVKLLLKSGADIEAKDDAGLTSLSCAVANGHSRAVVKLLL
jgi:hypothetical protein